VSELHVYYHGLKDNPLLVGQLASFKKKIYFEYDTKFLALDLNLSPFLLPLKSGAQTPQSGNPWNGLFGVFNDSLPDGWGLLLMDRHLQSLGVDVQYLSPLDRLAYIGNRGMGALSYKPAKSMSKAGFDIDLSELAALRLQFMRVKQVNAWLKWRRLVVRQAVQDQRCWCIQKLII